MSEEKVAQKVEWKRVENTGSEGKMDFGGLPERDLKKNLGGCG